MHRWVEEGDVDSLGDPYSRHLVVTPDSSQERFPATCGPKQHNFFFFFSPQNVPLSPVQLVVLSAAVEGQLGRERQLTHVRERSQTERIGK